MPLHAVGDILRFQYFIRKLVSNSWERSKLYNSNYIRIKFYFTTDLSWVKSPPTECKGLLDSRNTLANLNGLENEQQLYMVCTVFDVAHAMTKKNI